MYLSIVCRRNDLVNCGLFARKMSKYSEISIFFWLEKHLWLSQICDVVMYFMFFSAVIHAALATATPPTQLYMLASASATTCFFFNVSIWFSLSHSVCVCVQVFVFTLSSKCVHVQRAHGRTENERVQNLNCARKKQTANRQIHVISTVKCYERQIISRCSFSFSLSLLCMFVGNPLFVARTCHEFD